MVISNSSKVDRLITIRRASHRMLQSWLHHYEFEMESNTSRSVGARNQIDIVIKKGEQYYE